jgi:hypothetical protein
MFLMQSRNIFIDAKSLTKGNLAHKVLCFIGKSPDPGLGGP